MRADLYIIEGIWNDKVEVELPYIMGHENASWVEEAVGSVEFVKPGDPVIMHLLVTHTVIILPAVVNAICRLKTVFFLGSMPTAVMQNTC